ncbi:DUF3500 domain-containing protein [Paracoccaceae bacterium GXU_MW_L88]
MHATKLISFATFLAASAAQAQMGNLQTPEVPMELKDSIEVPAADAQTAAMVDAADAFLNTLSEEQRGAAIYDFDDNTQRANWSNFPDGAVVRGGVMRGDLNDTQLEALDALIATVLSEDGARNAAMQVAADDALGQDGGDRANFGSDYYYVSFLGQPSTTAPWMFQFGGHHLAINATVVGPDVSFSPMLTGGEPLNITFEDQAVYITQEETEAAQAMIDSLDETQREAAIQSDEAINLLSGPGEYGTEIAAEGIRASGLNDEQKALLVALIETRIGLINEDDAAAAMEVIEAELDETTFGWWGPTDTLGAGYYRITGPSLILEYSPQAMDGDPTDHAHNMYRNPQNDYGDAWIAVE